MTALPLAASPRTGVRHWIRSYATMLAWHAASLRVWAVTTIVVEIMAGCGMVLGVGLLVPDISHAAALYCTTGTAVVTLIMVGLIIGPQFIAQERTDGTYEYLLGLPVPRTAAAVAWVTICLALALPGAIAALALGAWHYRLDLGVSPAIVPAALLASFTATMLGYAVANAIERPMVTIVLTQLFIFLAFGYAPINFPPGQMPHWLAEANRGLPFLPMATVVRDGLVPGFGARVTESYAVLCAWAVGSAAVAALAIERRR